jgi:hypothetical protein
VAAAIGISAILSGSVFSFAIAFLFTITGLAWCILMACRSQHHEFTFCCGFSVVGIVGVLWSLFSPAAMTETTLVAVMWWDATAWGNGLGWNAASFQGSHYLLLTWLAAYSGGWLASLFFDPS